MTQMKKRPFLMSKSSVAGMAAYASTYSGENEQSWAALEQSVNDQYLASTYGMPFHGSDICGHTVATGETKADAELCARWYLLAASQPFGRNYAAMNSPDQAPYAFTEMIPGSTTETYKDMIISAMQLKYNFLRYMVTSFHDISMNGGAYYMPLFFEFPAEAVSYQ